MVVIGHSMGGSISRLMITDANDKCGSIFGKPPAKGLSPETKQILAELSSSRIARKSAG